jgi:hypothetical protein
VFELTRIRGPLIKVIFKNTGTGGSLNLKLKSKKQKLKLKVIKRIQYPPPPQNCFKPHFDFALIFSVMMVLLVGQRSKKSSPKNPQISSQKSLSPGKMGGSQILQRGAC